MKKIVICICSFFLLITFTGCIEIFENIIFDKKGGGYVQLKLDMSQMAAMMESMKGMGDGIKEDKSVSKEDDPSTTGKQMTSDWERFKEIEGITNVNIMQDTVGMIYTVDYDFVNEVALNKALTTKGDNSDKGKKKYAIGRSSITRNDSNDFENMTDSKDEEEVEMMKTMMADMKFHLSISVPGNIKSVSNKKAVISDDKKTIKLETSYKDISEKTTSLGMKINY